MASNQRVPQDIDQQLWNEDLAPSDPSKRTWTAWNISSLWVGLVVCVPAYLLASSLMQEGMNWWQAVVIILLGNLVILFPMMLIGHAGTQYGVPFPVLLRSAFGTIGARVPAALRGLVACGWFGIQTWVGGSAIYQIVAGLTGFAAGAEPIGWLGIDAYQLLCFLGFWGVQVIFIQRGMESIRWLETFAAPILIGTTLLMLYWAISSVDELWPLLNKPSAFVAGGAREGEFWLVFWPGLTAMIGFWSTLTLNIPDFTRYARSQRDQIVGQMLGLPIPMAFLALVSVVVTASTAAIFGETLWDPVAIAGKLGGSAALFGLVMLTIATLTTNLAANVVAPANSFANLAPSRISFKMGGYITAGIGIAIMPWQLLESAGSYLFVWLVGYSSLLGPIAGILITDYYFIQKRALTTEDLYRRSGRYHYSGGWHIPAFLALAIGVGPNLPGFLQAVGALDQIPAFFEASYRGAWFVGAILAGTSYLVLVKLIKPKQTQG